MKHRRARPGPNRHLLAALATCLGALVSPTLHAAPDAGSPCPRLPPGSGLTWSVQRGPDFDVCYANVKGRPTAGLIGVYLGQAPNFRPGPTFVREGRMDGAVVRWYRKTPEGSGGPKLALETLHGLGQETAHVWVMADDERRLDALRALAEAMSFAK